MKIKKSKFENEDSQLPTVLILETKDNVYVYFDSYRTIGTEVLLKRGNVNVGKILLGERGLRKFKTDFEKARA